MKHLFEETINILVVDDSIDNVAALELSLTQEGLKIFTTTVPEDALQLCLDKDISIALIDVQMPGMDGFEVLDLIKGNPLTEHIMVILITGYSMSTDFVIKGLDKGAVDYLFKPMDLHITNAKIHSLKALVHSQREIIRKNQELESFQGELFKAIQVTEQSKVIKENFLANMSHEIRTPLNAIIGLTHLLNKSEINKDQKELIKLMEFSTESLLGIVNDILDSAKIDSGNIHINRSKTNIINLVETIADLTRPLAEEKGLELICEIDSNVPAMIMADSLRLNQILLNIINNSIKFTNKGAINIGVKGLGDYEGHTVLEFKIQDSGIGIPSTSIDKIFNRFEQVEDKTWQKFGGTGLGLSIVKRLIELKGGKLGVNSVEGVGTTFTFTNSFKLAEDHQNAADPALTDGSPEEEISILLAEDNVINQFIVVKMLNNWNIKVDVATNGLEAFEMLKQKDYHLILMDMHMPVMNGYEATRKIRNEMSDEKKNIPIISFSASVIEQEKEEATNSGVDDFIDKPFEPKVLHHKVLKLIHDRKK